MSDLNVGIVGLGWVAGAHIETFKAVEGGSVTAVCSRREHDEADLATQFGTPLKAYTSYDEMLADGDIDVVDICTPHPFHAEQAIAAARAGKHLIIEKPVCLTYEDLVAVGEAVEESGVEVCVCFECRYSAHFTLIRSVIDQGLLGELHFAEVDYYHGIGPWYGQYGWNVKKDMGGSSLLTAGCHALDACLFFMDGKVEEVSSYQVMSKGVEFAPYEYNTTSVSTLKFAGGEKLAKVTSCIDCLQPYYFHIHLVGSEGSLLDNRIYSKKLKGMVKDQVEHPRDLADRLRRRQRPPLPAAVPGIRRRHRQERGHAADRLGHRLRVLAGGVRRGPRRGRGPAGGVVGAGLKLEARFRPLHKPGVGSGFRRGFDRTDRHWLQSIARMTAVRHSTP